MTNEDRFKNHLIPLFLGRDLMSINRDDLQRVLDEKAAEGFSYSVVGHLRWDFKQIFHMAVSEGIVARNPASLLFVPKQVQQPVRRVMSFEEVRKLFDVLEQRERLIVKIAVLSGTRPGEPGEIFALTRSIAGALCGNLAAVLQRSLGYAQNG